MRDRIDAPVWAGHDGKRYLRYRAVLLTSSPSRTPRLESVSVGY